MPFVSDKPYGLGAGIVLASTPEVIQFDETDHMLDSAWRANDHTKRYDYLQLLKNELALATLFAAKHAAGTGVHAPLGLSSMCDLTDAEWSATFSGLPSSAYVTQAFATASGFRSLLISPRDVTNVNPLECLCVFASGGQILHGFRALSGGSVHAYVKSWLYSDSTAYGGAAIRRQPTLYDATVQGLGWVKDMYRQGFRGALDVLSVYSRWHNRMTGEQRISFNAGLISTFYTSSIVASSLYSCAHALLCAHPTRPTVYLHRASPASGQVVVRTGFDDTSVYAVIETISGSPGTVPVTSMSAQVTKAAPTTYSLDWTDRSAFGFSAGEPAAAQILGNLTTLVRTFDEEHSILTGSHEIPVSSIKGYRMAYSATISAPATVGDQLLVEIEANPNIGEHHVYLPRMVGAAGSGVCTASIAFTETTVYLLVKRITAGTSNSFDAEVYVIDDE